MHKWYTEGIRSMLYVTGVDLKMATSPKNAFKEFYPKLLEIIPISHLITLFYSQTLLSHDHKGMYLRVCIGSLFDRPNGRPVYSLTKLDLI